MEFLATGRKPVYEEAPIILNMVKTVDRIVEVEKIVEKPVVKRIVRVKYLRNPIEFLCVAVVCFLLGLIIGVFL